MTQIRALAVSDRSDWDRLWDGYCTFYDADIPTEVSEATWSRLLDPGEDMHALVAVGEDRLCGLAHFLFHRSTWALSNYCYLEDLYVAPEARGRGAGRALIEGVYDRADQAGASRVYWSTQESNRAARALYDRLADLTDFVQYRRS